MTLFAIMFRCGVSSSATPCCSVVSVLGKEACAVMLLQRVCASINVCICCRCTAVMLVSAKVIFVSLIRSFSTCLVIVSYLSLNHHFLNLRFSSLSFKLAVACMIKTFILYSFI